MQLCFCASLQFITSGHQCFLLGRAALRVRGAKWLATPRACFTEETVTYTISLCLSKASNALWGDMKSQLNYRSVPGSQMHGLNRGWPGLCVILCVIISQLICVLGEFSSLSVALLHSLTYLSCTVFLISIPGFHLHVLSFPPSLLISPFPVLSLPGSQFPPTPRR